MDDNEFKKMMELRVFDPELDQPINLPNNQQATEYTTTSQLPSGEWVVHPQIWWDGEGKSHFYEGESSLQIVEMQEAFGSKPFPRFKTVEEANSFAAQRSKQEGGLEGKIR